MPTTRFRQRTAIERFHDCALLGLIASGYLAIVGSGFIDTPTAVLAGAGLLVKAAMVAGWIRLRLSPKIVNATTLLYLGFYPIDYLYISHEFLSATVRFVFFLVVIKVLTAETRRDYLFVRILAFLELIAASILSANINYFVCLALFLVFGVATFSSWEIYRAAENPRNLVRATSGGFGFKLTIATAITTVFILIFTAGLFFVLPRTARAAFRHLVPERYHLVGFSNEVSLGEIGEIQQQSTTVMRVRILDKDPGKPLRWRGAALAEFDGRKWFNPPSPGELLRVHEGLVPLADSEQLFRNGQRLRYEVQLRPVISDVIFFAGVPEFVDLSSRLLIRTPTDSYRVGYSGGEPLRYYAFSYLGDGRAAGGKPLNLDQKNQYLRLPDADRRILELAKSITGGMPGDILRAQALESWLQNAFPYTLELPKNRPEDPVAYFLFDRKKGHCEYFASSMAVMLRLIGIPSRVVTGFYGGQFNPLSGWYQIRSSDAHSWVEAWIPDRGWVLFDPTPAARSNPTPSAWNRIQLYFDAADTFWQDWVLNYDLDRQLQLATKVERGGEGFRMNWFERVTQNATRWKSKLTNWTVGHAAVFVAILAAAVGLILFGPEIKRRMRRKTEMRRIERGQVRPTDATLLYERMLLELAKRGIEKPPWLTPLEFSSTVSDELVEQITVAYNELRYGGDSRSAKRMVELLDRLENTKAEQHLQKV